MNEYVPFEPRGGSALINWANYTHKAAFSERRMLMAPGARLIQTSQGVFQRPIAEESTSEQPPVDSFYFAIRWTFPNGIRQPIFNPSDGSLGHQEITLELFGDVSQAAASEASFVFPDVQSGGQTDFTNGLVKITRPLNPDWVIDFGYRQTIGDFSFHGLCATFCQYPASNRIATDDPLRQFGPMPIFTPGLGGQVPLGYFPWRNFIHVRYYFTPEIQPELVCLSIGSNFANSYRFQPNEQLEQFFPAGVAFELVAHAHNIAGLASFFPPRANIPPWRLR